MYVSLSAGVKVPKGCNLYGQVTCDGQACAGVWVSDGVNIVKTDRKGFYYLDSDKKEGTVFVSVPSCTEVKTEHGMPEFWHRLSSRTDSVERHDFSLTHVDNKNFALIAVSDS